MTNGHLIRVLGSGFRVFRFTPISMAVGLFFFCMKRKAGYSMGRDTVKFVKGPRYSPYFKHVLPAVAEAVGSALAGKVRNMFTQTDETKPENQHTAHQLTQGIDQSMSLYRRKRKSPKQMKKHRIRIKRRRKARKRILKLLRPSKVMNLFYEQATSKVAVSTVEASNAWLNQYPVTIAGTTLFRGSQWGSNNDVNQITGKLSDIGWVHNNTTQDQNKTHNLRAYVKTTVLGSFVPTFSASVFPNGIKFDVYECVAQKDISDSNYQDPYTAWATVLGSLNTWQGSSLPGTNRKGLTPFECTGFLEWWKILNVTRHYIGSTDTVQFKYSQKGVVDKDRHNGLYAIKGKTKSVMFIFHPIYNGETANGGVARAEGEFYFLKKHKYYSLSLESSITGTGELAIANAVTQAL